MSKDNSINPRTRCLDVPLYIIGFIVPPIAVIFKVGFRGSSASIHVILNIFLWAFGWLPGVIHAMYIIATWDKRKRQQPHVIVVQQAPQDQQPQQSNIPSQSINHQPMHQVDYPVYHKQPHNPTHPVASTSQNDYQEQYGESGQYHNEVNEEYSLPIVSDNRPNISTSKVKKN